MDARPLATGPASATSNRSRRVLNGARGRRNRAQGPQERHRNQPGRSQDDSMPAGGQRMGQVVDRQHEEDGAQVSPGRGPPPRREEQKVGSAQQKQRQRDRPAPRGQVAQQQWIESMLVRRLSAQSRLLIPVQHGVSSLLSGDSGCSLDPRARPFQANPGPSRVHRPRPVQANPGPSRDHRPRPVQANPGPSRATARGWST